MLAGYWHQIPFVRFIIPLSMGIGFNMFFPPNVPLLVLLAVTLTILLVLYRKKTNFPLFGILLNICFFILGIAINESQNHLNYPNHYSKAKSDYLVVQITEPAQLRSNSIKCHAQVIQRIFGTQSASSEGKLLIYFEKDTQILASLKYGNRLLIPNKTTTIKKPQNPFEFNYKRYLAFNQIYQQCYLLKNEFILIDNEGGNFLWKMAYQAQAFFDAVLVKYVKTSNEIAISKALLYGYDDEIAPDLVRAYSNTGTLHVLAVSGMHVGLIFWLINLLLKYLDKKKYQRIIKLIISITIIWCYSLLCGLSPSILRASVMFSFLAIGKIFKHQPNIYNTLSASAFVLLLVNSNMLASVGFQLSFLAVFGIVSLQKYIYNWFSFNNRIGIEIWNITSVSIAAQLATFPIGLLYFHQFPVYFLASNLLIIPLTTFIIFIALAMLFCAALVKWLAFFSLLANFLGFMVKWLIQFTNVIVLWLEKLPFSYLSGIHISEIETLIIYIGIVYVCYYFINRQKLYFKFALTCFLLFLIFNSTEKIKNAHRKSITIYSINKTFAMQIFDGNKSILISDTSLLRDSNKFRFHLQQHIWANQAKKTDTIPFLNQLNLTVGSLKLNIGQGIKDSCINILTKNTFIDTSKVYARNTQVVFSSKISLHQAKNMAHFLSFKNILPYNCMESGALTINIEN